MAEFRTRHFSLIVQLTRDVVSIVGAEVVKTPARAAIFERGVFETEDEETIRLLRKHPAFKKGEVWELTDRDKAIAGAGMKPPAWQAGPPNTRGAQSVLDVGRTTPGAGDEKPQLKEKDAFPADAVACPVCGMKFKNTGGLQRHMIVHRKSVQVKERDEIGTGQDAPPASEGDAPEGEKE